jgi:hypothetical protein
MEEAQRKPEEPEKKQPRIAMGRKSREERRHKKEAMN